MDKSPDNKQHCPNMVITNSNVHYSPQRLVLWESNLFTINCSLMTTHIQLKKYKSVQYLYLDTNGIPSRVKNITHFCFIAQPYTGTSNCSLSLQGVWYLSIGGQLKKPIHSSVKCSENITAHQQQLSKLAQHPTCQRRKCISGCSPTHDDIWSTQHKT